MNNGSIKTEKRVPIRGEADIIAARQAAREMSSALGFGSVDQSRIATAVSELVRNVIRYATDGRGDVWLHQLPSSPRGVGIELVVTDGGPGITDLDLALHAGYTSGRGLGMGLPGTRRLMDETNIDSALGRGTTVTIRKWHR